MTERLIKDQLQLPPFFNLFRYTPERPAFSFEGWDPAKVRTAKDLPPYSILGALDEDTVQITSEGWSATWQGTENDTQFRIKYLAEGKRYNMDQKWCGVDGGFSTYPSKIPLGKLIGQALYMRFPWDREAKKYFEQKYQITYVKQPEGTPSFFGIPDGAFRTVAFPVSTKNIESIQDMLKTMTRQSRLSYPSNADAKLLFQSLCYLEGKAPDGSRNAQVLFDNSIAETGLIPQGFPVMETSDDGSSCWSLCRDVYVLFVTVPFAGLTDFLERMARSIEKSPIRQRDSAPIPVQMQPIIVPPMLEHTCQHILLWDKELTTRCFWHFSEPGEKHPTLSTNDLIINGGFDCAPTRPMSAAKNSTNPKPTQASSTKQGWTAEDFKKAEVALASIIAKIPPQNQPDIKEDGKFSAADGPDLEKSLSETREQPVLSREKGQAPPLQGGLATDGESQITEGTVKSGPADFDDPVEKRFVTYLPRLLRSSGFRKDLEMYLNLADVGKSIDQILSGAGIEENDRDLDDAIFCALRDNADTVLSLAWDGDGPGCSGGVWVDQLEGVYIVTSSDYSPEGPFESLDQALALDCFWIPTPKPELDSKSLPLDRLIKIAQGVVDWDNEEDIWINKERYVIANGKLVPSALE